MLVKIEHAQLMTAARSLDSLASSLEAQASSAQRLTPIDLPSLDSSTLKQQIQWMKDQQPMLKGLADIALLLDTDGNGSSEYDVGNSVADVKEMLGRTLAEKAHQVTPHDAEFSDQYLEIFQAWANDPSVATTFHEALGPEGTLEVLSQWAVEKDNHVSTDPTETQRQLLATMKTTLETATEDWSPSQNREFAEGLVEAATTHPEDTMRDHINYNPSGALSYLLYEGRYSQEFLTPLADGLDEYERIEMDGSPGLWGHRPDNGADFGQYMPFGSAMTYNNLDPMTSLMSAFERNAEAGLEFFDSDERAKYYIQERNWDQDGYDSITGALDAATTDAQLIADPSSDTARAAAELASRTVHYFSDRENWEDSELIDHLRRGGSENGASENLAHILATYMVGVDTAVNLNEGADAGPGVANRYMDAYGGTVANIPLFDEESLQRFSLLAMATDDGFAQVRAGLSRYRAEKLGALADGVYENDTANTRDQLSDGIGEDGQLEGFFINALGDERIAQGGAKDARIEAWVDGAASVVDLIPVPGASKLGEGVAADLVNLAVDEGKGAGTDAIKEALANYEESARSDAEDLATQTLRSQTYAVAQVLDERNLSANPEGMAPIARPDGHIIAWDDFQKLDDAEQVEVLSNLYSNGLGVGRYFDGQDYEEAYRAKFTGYFEGAQG